MYCQHTYMYNYLTKLVKYHLYIHKNNKGPKVLEAPEKDLFDERKMIILVRRCLSVYFISSIKIKWSQLLKPFWKSIKVIQACFQFSARLEMMLINFTVKLLGNYTQISCFSLNSFFWKSFHFWDLVFLSKSILQIDNIS